MPYYVWFFKSPLFSTEGTWFFLPRGSVFAKFWIAERVRISRIIEDLTSPYFHITESIICRFCEETEEIGWHILCECPTIWTSRKKCRLPEAKSTPTIRYGPKADSVIRSCWGCSMGPPPEALNYPEENYYNTTRMRSPLAY